jgi:hypothetical protein
MVSYDFTNPQSFNRYSYALNNPANLVDPSGLDPVCGIDPDTGLLECTSSYPSDPCTDDPSSCGGGWVCGEYGCGAPGPSGTNQDPGGGSGGGAPGSGPPHLAKTSSSCSAGSFGKAVSKIAGSNALINASYTSSTPGIALGALIGSAFGPVGAFAGGILGSQLGAGGSISYVPSTGSIYVGVVATAGAGYNGGGGLSVSSTPVPSSQSPNAIANGPSYSVTFLPWGGIFGSNVSKSPGSGPPVIGFAAGTRSPVSGSASYSICITHCGC